MGVLAAFGLTRTRSAITGVAVVLFAFTLMLFSFVSPVFAGDILPPVITAASTLVTSGTRNLSK